MLLSLCDECLSVEQLVADVRREHDRDHPGSEQRDGDHLEDGDGVFTRRRLGEANGGKSDGGDERTREHRERRRSVGIGRCFEAIPALLHLHHHHLHRDDGIVHQQSQCDDQGTKRDALQVDAEHLHRKESDG